MLIFQSINILLEGKINAMVKPKSYLDFIAEDESLTKKITLEEFENNEFAPENSDETVEEAYAAYKRVMEKLNA